MQQSNLQRAKRIPKSLNFSQEQVTFILGHSLRSLYKDVFAAELLDRPKHLWSNLRAGIPLPRGPVKLGSQRQWNE